MPNLITHVEFGRSYSKVHRLVTPTDRIPDGAPLACGRVFRSGHLAAGWSDFDESNNEWMCKRCRNVSRHAARQTV